VRNTFRTLQAVVDDQKPDRGIIITCNGFKKDATIYVKHKGIKLAILRKFSEADRKRPQRSF
jgi:hypothetical protein